MTTADDQVWQQLAELRGQAIQLLTQAAQLTRPRGMEPGGPREPIDFADFIAGVLAAVAANRGSVEALLSGRPGSWEADYVRQLLLGTVGHDEEYLLERRTEPVVVKLSIEDAISDGGHTEQYEPDDREQAIAEKAAQAGVSVEEWLARWTGHEPVFRRWIPLIPNGQTYEDEREALGGRHNDAFEALTERYGVGEAAAINPAYDAEASELDRVYDENAAALHRKWQRRYERYAAAFEANVRAKATEWGLTVRPEFSAVTDPDEVWGATGTSWDDDPLAARLWEHALTATPSSLLTTDEESV